jgi:hypothetical protein
MLKHIWSLRQLWQLTRDPACKTAVNWVAETIRRMTRRKTLELWETKVGNCEVTPRALWPIVKSRMEWDGPKAPTTVHVPVGVSHWNEKGNVTADCLENQFTSHDLCDENHTRQQALLASVADILLGKVSPCDIHKLANSLKQRGLWTG